MKHLRASLLALLAFAAFASPAFAQRSDHDVALTAVEQREALPLSRIMSIARGAVPGEIIEVELDRDNGRLIYAVKILTSTGRVREVELDARSGAVLRTEDED